MTHGFLTAGRLRKSRRVDATVDSAIPGMRCGAGARHGGEHLACESSGDGASFHQNVEVMESYPPEMLANVGLSIKNHGISVNQWIDSRKWKP